MIHKCCVSVHHIAKVMNQQFVMHVSHDQNMRARNSEQILYLSLREVSQRSLDSQQFGSMKFAISCKTR
jgi:hypothetical protein